MISSLAHLGLPALFASRIFLPAFAAALLLRFGADLGVDGRGVLQALDLGAAPAWFVSDPALWILGLLSFCELTAQHIPESRELLTLVDQYAKPLMALATSFGLMGAVDQQFLEQSVLRGQPGLLTALIGLMVTGGTWVLATARNAVVSSFQEGDQDDDSGLFGLMAWGEDLFAFFGVAFLLLFPVLVLVLLAVVSGTHLLLRRRARRLEERKKVTCPTCRGSMFRSAIQCAACRAPNPAPMELDWLGSSTDVPVRNLSQHPFKLLRHRRCARCADQLQARRSDPSCGSCGHAPFASPETVQAYDQSISARLLPTLVISTALGFIPVVGLIPGIIHCRLVLVAPYRRYLPRRTTLLLRWGVRLVSLGLIAFQWVPVIGGLSIPAMALLNHTVYRNRFLELAHRTQQPASAEVQTASLG